MEYEIIKTKITSPNRIVNASPPSGGSGSVRLGRSLRSLPRLTPPQFASPAKPTVLLIRAVKPSFTTGTLYEITAKIYWKW
jgi:hypothetical protein